MIKKQSRSEVRVKKHMKVCFKYIRKSTKPYY